MIGLAKDNGVVIISGISENWIKSFETKIELNIQEEGSLSDMKIDLIVESGWGCFLIKKNSRNN